MTQILSAARYANGILRDAATEAYAALTEGGHGIVRAESTNQYLASSRRDRAVVTVRVERENALAGLIDVYVTVSDTETGRYVGVEVRRDVEHADTVGEMIREWAQAAEGLA